MVNGKGRKMIGIVIPVFNDWESLNRLIRKLNDQSATLKFDFHIFVVDDGSTEPRHLDYLSTTSGISEVQLIRLFGNIGHQRAIAVGLVVASRIEEIEAVVVMDADGEDRPEDVSRLAAAWSENTNRIVVAQRGERSEGLAFRFFYAIYKQIFRIMTGQKIDFGNFCLLPRELLRALTYNPSIWNSLPAAITRSRIPYTAVRVARGTRLAGKSKMNFESLVVHGMSAIAVYADVVLLRILLGACMLAGVGFRADGNCGHQIRHGLGNARLGILFGCRAHHDVSAGIADVWNRTFSTDEFSKRADHSGIGCSLFHR